MFMWHTAVLLLFLSTSPVQVSSLQCFLCTELIIVNYLVTSDTVPEFAECQIVSAAQCSITVTWDENINVTAIAVNTQNTSSTQDASEDIIKPMALVEAGPYGGVPFFAHSLVFSCMSSDQCNNQSTLQRILRSLTIEDKFGAELLPLIKIFYPFNPRTAACFNFKNTTGLCPPIDLDDCQRCEISIDQVLSSPPEVCATCHRNSVDVNVIIHSTTFALNNRTRIADHVQLDCQLRACNSIANINQVYKASNITFDFGKFFEN